MTERTTQIHSTDTGSSLATRNRKGRWLVALAFSVVLTFALSLGAVRFIGLGSASAGVGGAQESFQIDVGDVIQVADGAVGCTVKVRNGAKVLDCRRAGNLAKTYGMLLTNRDVRVVRFRSNNSAAVVFTAKHRRAQTTRCTGR